MSLKIFSDGLTRNTLILFIMLGLFNFFNLIYHFIMGRFLSLADYGTLGALFTIIYILGVPSEAIQNISAQITSHLNFKKEDGKIKNFVKRSLKRGLFFSVVIFLILAATSIFLSFALKINFWLIIVTDLFIFLSILTPISRGVLQGKKKFFLFGSTFVIESVSRLGFSLLFVIIGWKVFGAIFGVLLGIFLSFIISLFFIKNIFKVKEERVEFPGIYGSSVPFFVATLVIISMMGMDTLFAKIFFDPDTAGKYVAVSMIGRILFFGTMAVGRTMFPSTAEKFEQDRETSKILKRSFLIIILISLVILSFYYIIPETIVSLIYGDKFLDISPLIIYSGISLVFLSLSNLILLYGLATNKLKNSYILFIFPIIEIMAFSLFHNNLMNYILAFMVCNITMFLFSLLWLNKWQKA